MDKIFLRDNKIIHPALYGPIKIKNEQFIDCKFKKLVICNELPLAFIKIGQKRVTVVLTYF